MKKNYVFKTVLFLIPFSAFILMSVSSGRTGSYSGSPGDSNTTCTQCHSGGAFGTTMTIETEIPATGYDLGVPYDIQIEVSGTAATKHGFQITAEKVSDGSKIGTWTVDGSNIQLVNGGTHVTHTTSGNTVRTWTASWKAPVTDQGAIKFYVAAVAADGTGGTGGDQVITGSTSNFSLGISEAKRLDFSLYPNPSSSEVNIQLATGSENATVEFYNYIGKKVLSKEITTLDSRVNVQNLSSGVYILKVKTADKIGTQKFIKE